MKAIDIISKLPHKTFESQAAYWERNKTVLEQEGFKPYQAKFDDVGNCKVCGEAGRCPGWHTIDDLLERLMQLAYQEYINRGYMYSGNLWLGFIAISLSITDDAAAEVIRAAINAGLLVQRKCRAIVYELPAVKRLELIRQHKLDEKWEREAPYSYPNDYYGEVASVLREVNDRG